MSFIPKQGFALAFAGLALLHMELQAQTFSYNTGDLILGLRRSGNASDLIINLGPASVFEGYAPGSKTVITRLTVAQLDSTFSSGDYNGVSWSISGAVRAGGGSHPIQTIYVTASRLDAALEVQSTPWKRQGQFTQGATASAIDGLGGSVRDYASLQPAGANNTATAVLVPSTSANSYTYGITGTGDFNTFQGSVENTTDVGFTDNYAISRSDLYVIEPAAASLQLPGKLLGNFDLASDGTLSFSAAASVVRPVITKINRSAGTSTVSFTTGSSGSYSLRYTDATGLSTPVSTWSVGGSITGSGGVQSIQDTTGGANHFYSIEAHP